MVRRPGERCTTSALVCTFCTRGVQENGSICLVVLQTVEIPGLIICLAEIPGLIIWQYISYA